MRFIYADLPKRLEGPGAFGHKSLLQDVQIPVVRAHLEKRVLRAVPPVQHFLHPVQGVIQPEANRPLVCFVP